MHTRLTELLEIEHSIMLAGMGGVSSRRLVASVSEAGGVGTLVANTMSADELVPAGALVRLMTEEVERSLARIGSLR